MAKWLQIDVPDIDDVAARGPHRQRVAARPLDSDRVAARKAARVAHRARVAARVAARQAVSLAKKAAAETKSTMQSFEEQVWAVFKQVQGQGQRKGQAALPGQLPAMWQTGSQSVRM